MALQYPEDVMVEIEDFARYFPQDAVHPSLALLALHLWLDIMGHETRMKEPFIQSGSDVGDVDLGVFILYFPHYLRYTENQRHLHYLHPFRYVATAYQRDLLKSDLFQVQPAILSVENMCSFVQQAESKTHGVLPTDRIEFLPQDMHGSLMARPTGALSAAPSEVLKALVGIGNIYQHGLPCYRFEDGPQITAELIVPKDLLDSLMRGPHENVGNSQGIFDYTDIGTPSIVTGSVQTLGPVFRPAFQRSNAPTGTSLPAPLHGWPRIAAGHGPELSTVIAPSIHHFIRAMGNQSIQHAVDIGLVVPPTGRRVYLDSQNRITYFGMVSPERWTTMTEEEKVEVRRLHSGISDLTNTLGPPPDGPPPDVPPPDSPPPNGPPPDGSPPDGQNTAPPTPPPGGPPATGQVAQMQQTSFDEVSGILGTWSVVTQPDNAVFHLFLRILAPNQGPAYGASCIRELRDKLTNAIADPASTLRTWKGLHIAIEGAATDLDFRLDSLHQLAHLAPLRSRTRLAVMRVDRWLAQTVAAIVGVPSGTASDHTEWDLTLRTVMTAQYPRTAALVEGVMTQAQQLPNDDTRVARAAKPLFIVALALLYMHIQYGIPPPGWEAARSRLQHLAGEDF
ncbi:hypothetical protein LEL_01676 [Akanthomyces lecanii RCEF 1005]|uniref:Uncharacterized protein n=1 Tax=Akanthomyces lecanii RCEF 1005 TaxID=1081108 RepID=A0A168KTI5_CORDF|nr:hypothetical protein LEL_01676 [Akanthomyces lecanii RCEF 1005]